MQDFSAFDGALLIDKPSGPTSHDIVDAVRRRFGFKKVGHCGTLDPNATGLLILVLGKGTKLSERLMATDKVYEGDMVFGVSTSSYDSDGEVTATRPVPPLTIEQLNEMCLSLAGDQLQTPPMVSAIKKDGVPLYKLARKGIEVERKPRLIHVYSFKISDYQEPRAHFRVASTKGCYVRSLVHDLGEKVGCGAHLAALRRTVSGAFKIEEAIAFKEALELSPSQLKERVIPFLQLTTRE